MSSSSLGNTTNPPPLVPLSPQQAAYQILSQNCAGCHGVTLNQGKVGNILDLPQLISAKLIIPKSSATSPLYQAIAANRMPLGGTLSLVNKTAIAKWIDEGALPYDTTLPNSAPPLVQKTVTLAQTLVRIAADIQQVTPADRPFIRYVTLNHLTQRALFAKGVAKALNSIHWKSAITIPLTVDADQTALRIDLRQFEMTAADWDRAVAAYPYLSELTGSAFTTVKTATAAIVPVVRADFFVRTILQGQLYKDLLEIPDQIATLEQKLEVNVASSLDGNLARRSGFKFSGVSLHNRVIERHQGLFGAYWKSYDFASDDGLQNIFENPLGPAGATTLGRAFAHNGGEMIFTLPNGLHGYVLTDAAGNYLNQAPTTIVQDPSRRDRTVTNGISCFTCHTAGWIPKKDEIRSAAAALTVNPFSITQLTKINALFPTQTAIDSLINADISSYVKAMQALSVSLGGDEPVSTTTHYYDADLTMATMAAELETSVDALKAALSGNPELKNQLGAAGDNGILLVQRTTFESLFSALQTAVLAAQ